VWVVRAVGVSRGCWVSNETEALVDASPAAEDRAKTSHAAGRSWGAKRIYRARSQCDMLQSLPRYSAEQTTKWPSQE
jgi:hypothetical protein